RRRDAIGHHGRPQSMTEPPASQLPKSAAELEELVESFEGKTRHPPGLLGRAITAALVVMSLYHLWATTANVVTQIHRTIHLLFVLVLTFLVYPDGRALPGGFIPPTWSYRWPARRPWATCSSTSKGSFTARSCPLPGIWCLASSPSC